MPKAQQIECTACCTWCMSWAVAGLCSRPCVVSGCPSAGSVTICVPYALRIFCFVHNYVAVTLLAAQGPGLCICWWRRPSSCRPPPCPPPPTHRRLPLRGANGGTGRPGIARPGVWRLGVCDGVTRVHCGGEWPPTHTPPPPGPPGEFPLLLARLRAASLTALCPHPTNRRLPLSPTSTCPCFKSSLHTPIPRALPGASDSGVPCVSEPFSRSLGSLRAVPTRHRAAPLRSASCRSTPSHPLR